MCSSNKARALGLPQLKLTLILLLLPLLPALLAGLWHPRRPDFARAVFDSVAFSELAGANPLWIDARPAQDYAKGALPGALSLAPERYEEGFERLLELWQPDRLIVIYCDGGGCDSSENLARRLQADLGEGRIVILRDDWRSLKPTP